MVEATYSPTAKKNGSKLGPLFVLGFGLICFVFGNLSGFWIAYVDDQQNSNSNNQNTDSNPTNTPRPTNVLVSPTSTTNPYADWNEFILSDCKISMYAPEDWISGKRGDYAACGNFSYPVTQNVTSIENFPGVFIAFIAYDSQSPFAFKFDKNQNYTSYLKTMPTDPKNLRPDQDLLISQEEREISNNKAIYAKIQRPTLGITENIFYTRGTTQYVIIWGGQDIEAQADVIQLILQSIKFV